MRSHAARTEIRREKIVDVGVRRQSGETRETAVRLQALRRAHEATPSREGQRAADADAPDAERRQVPDTQAAVAGDQEVEWFRPDRFHESLNFYRLVDARCEEHIGTRLCVSLETADRFAEGIPVAGQVALGPG